MLRDYRNVKDKAEKDPENEESWKVFKKDNDLVRTLFQKADPWGQHEEWTMEKVFPGET